MRHVLAGSCAAFAIVASLALSTTALAATPPAGAGPTEAELNAPIPRLANGKPDFSGYWGRGGPGFALSAIEDEDEVYAIIPARDGRLTNLENDSYIEQKAEENIPVYKPEHWARVRELDLMGNREDPTFHCKPAGVPRMGPPNRIIAFPHEVILFNNTVFRIIPIGKERNPNDLLIETWNGIPKAWWEGDTLVVESIGFNSEPWLGWGGFFTTFDLKVTERFTRKGNVLYYDAVAEDSVLLEPYRPNPSVLRLITNPNMTIPEATPCDERDVDNIENDLRG